MFLTWIKRLLAVMCFLGLAGAGLILSIDNMNPIALKFLSYDTSPYPLFVWLIGGFLLGFLLGFIVVSIGFFKNMATSAKLRKELNLARENPTEHAKGSFGATENE